MGVVLVRGWELETPKGESLGFFVCAEACGRYCRVQGAGELSGCGGNSASAGVAEWLAAAAGQRGTVLCREGSAGVVAGFEECAS
jgi:hypothetical protein